MSAEPRAASVGELLTALARDTGVLVRQEVELAATEMTVTATTAARSIALIAAGAALVHAGVVALLIGLMFALQGWVPLWLSGIIVAGVVIGAGYAVAHQGLSALRHLDPPLHHTAGTLRADVSWAKEQLR